MKNRQAYLLFLPRERKQLWGKNAINVFLLSGITLLALLSIGFASASMDYLDRTMRDPFVTCIDIDADQAFGKGYAILKDSIFSDNFQKQFGYSNPENVYYISETFLDVNGHGRQLDGRTFSMKSPLKDGTILSKSNSQNIRKTPIKDEDFGIILARSGMDKLGIQSPAFLKQSVNVGVLDENGDNIRKVFTFSVPVLAIVDQLPNMCDFLVTEAYASHDLNEGADHFNLSDASYNRELNLCCLNSQEEEIVKKVKDLAKDFTVSKSEADFSSWSDDYMKITIKTSLENRAFVYDSLFNFLDKRYDIYRLYDFGGSRINSQREPQLVSCYFGVDSLQYKVEAFKNRLEEEDLNYKLDMSKINNLKNLAYIQKMGNTLSLAIILISMVFICVFIYLLLTNHFQKIQCNLGTFKAFGVDDRMLNLIYLRIIGELVVLSYANAFVLSVVVHFVTKYLLNISWIDAFAWQNYLLLGLAIILSVFATVVGAGQLLKHSPGDLIYSRNQN